VARKDDGGEDLSGDNTAPRRASYSSDRGSETPMLIKAPNQGWMGRSRRGIGGGENRKGGVFGTTANQAASFGFDSFIDFFCENDSLID
jgi:hypothetical protein